MDYYIYCISTKITNKKKLGCTRNPIERMRVYNTGDPPGYEKTYDGIWQINVNSRIELLECEIHLHHHFESSRLRRSWGSQSEWFDVTLEQVISFLNAQRYVVRQLTLEEIDCIHIKSKSISTPTMTDVSCIIKNQKTLKDEFFSTFLPVGCIPRRIQNELWDLWESTSEKNAPYQGIIQWPTGVGKTIGILMMFVLSAHFTKKRGSVFRGLLIAPTNDIFDTIMHHIHKLSKWGIVVCEGHNARLSSLHIPHHKPIVVTATHASLTDSEIWNKLPSITHCHYDEVHRSTGNEFHRLLQRKLEDWNTLFLTGTSATPRTCNRSQHQKLEKLFGNPLSILHQCEVEEAIREGWIAQPRFGVTITTKHHDRKTILHSFVTTLRDSIMDKREKGLWKGGKVIVYLPLRSDVREAVDRAQTLMSDWYIYSAVEQSRANEQSRVLDDEKFKTDVVDGCPRILFACERYREGSDIDGIEMTVILMGNMMSANVLLQIMGRALRNDYKDKEGWCIIVRPTEDGITEEDIFRSIIIQIMEFIGKHNKTIYTDEKMKTTVEKFFGPLSISGKIYNVDETIQKIQSMYTRLYQPKPSSTKETYERIRLLNKERGIRSKNKYLTWCKEQHSDYIRSDYIETDYIENPKSYFNKEWVSWYHFLGVEISAFPPTKSEWIQKCKELGIQSWEDYKQRNLPSLPPNPNEMYDDFTNWGNELGIEEEDIVW
jgi:superfamily II DNA or RNA helicase